jgi:prevent-host-death family protein
MLTKTSAEAQNKFGELLDLAQREPVAITRHGRPAAFLVSPRDMEPILREKERRKKAVEDLKAWSEMASQNMSAGAEELTMEEINRIVHEVRAEIASRRLSGWCSIAALSLALL